MTATGDRIDGRFRLEQCVGSGGTGLVYAAIDEQTQRRVAIKFLRAAIVRSLPARLQLSRELEALERLCHPHIAELVAHGFLPDNSPYLVTELLEGRDLKAELRRRGPMPIGEVAAYLVQACRGVAAAHRQGIGHRDLKPHNLILTELDRIRQLKIVDFGVAQIRSYVDQEPTATDPTLDPPLYRCPEQLLDPKATSLLADVWALGIILYELLAGYSPFFEDSPEAVVAAVTLDEPAPIRALRPDVPETLAQLLEHALTKVPARRLASIEDFEQRLVPYAVAFDQLTIPHDSSAQPRIEVEPLPRIRGDFHLSSAIQSAIVSPVQPEVDTKRRSRSADHWSASVPVGRRVKIPILQLASTHPTQLARLSTLERGRERPGSDNVAWLMERAKSTTRMTASLFVVGVCATLVLLWLWQPRRDLSHFELMHAPSRSMPTPMTANAWNHAPADAPEPSAVQNESPFDAGPAWNVVTKPFTPRPRKPVKTLQSVTSGDIQPGMVSGSH